LLNLFKTGWDMWCRYYIRIRIRCSMSRICHKKKEALNDTLPTTSRCLRRVCQWDTSIRYYELKFYVFRFVCLQKFWYCKFGCLNSNTTKRKHYTL